jgi:hypothetical protein
MDMLRRYVSPPSIIAPNLVEKRKQRERVQLHLNSTDDNDLEDSIEEHFGEDSEDFTLADTRQRLKQQDAEAPGSSSDVILPPPIRTFRGSISIERSSPLIVKKNRKGMLVS